jgi:two-component system LytT family response regulator
MKKSAAVSCIVVDNDSRSVQQLSAEIKKLHGEIELLGVFQDPKEGYNRSLVFSPDVVFLNITFPWFNGQEMLGNTNTRAAKIIFLAKAENYVHQSIKGGRFDCLVKPYSQTELRRTLKRLKELNRTKSIQGVPSIVSAEHGYRFNKLALPTTRGYIFVDPAEIIYCQADQEYTRLVTIFNTHVISKNLKYFETRLDSKRFFRVHKSFVLNLEHMESYVKSDGGHVVMSDNKVIHIGRSRKSEFAALMGL